MLQKVVVNITNLQYVDGQYGYTVVFSPNNYL
jgi:hypothetical protein